MPENDQKKKKKRREEKSKKKGELEEGDGGVLRVENLPFSTAPSLSIT